MKKLFAITLIILYAALQSFSQDIIVLKNSGERIQAKVIEVGLTDIKYKNYDNQNGPVYTVSKADVDMILYVNGSKDVFIEVPENNDSTKAATNKNNNITTNKGYIVTPVNNTDLFSQGQMDAVKYYRGYRGAATGTLIVSLISPIVGLIPAVACSLTTPHGRYLMCPNSDLIQKPEYYAGYTLRAKKIKAGRVWRNWGIALGVNVIVILLTS